MLQGTIHKRGSLVFFLFNLIGQKLQSLLFRCCESGGSLPQFHFRNHNTPDSVADNCGQRTSSRDKSQDEILIVHIISSLIITDEKLESPRRLITGDFNRRQIILSSRFLFSKSQLHCRPTMDPISVAQTIGDMPQHLLVKSA